MKVTLKKNLIVFHSVREFEELHHRLLEEYGRATMLVSWRMKRELGFTIRHHKGLIPYTEKYGSQSLWLSKQAFEGKAVDRQHQMAYENQVHLDFYNEAQMSWFMLKYLNQNI